MKTVNRLISRIADFDNLRLAFWKASKGKRHAAEILDYQDNLEANLTELRGQILRGRLRLVIIAISRYLNQKSVKFARLLSANKFYTML